MAYNVLDLYQAVGAKPRGKRIAEAVEGGLQGLTNLGGALIQKGAQKKDDKARLDDYFRTLEIERSALENKKQQLEGEIGPQGEFEQARISQDIMDIDARLEDLRQKAVQAPQDVSFRSAGRMVLPEIGKMEQTDITPQIMDIKSRRDQKAREEKRAAELARTKYLDAESKRKEAKDDARWAAVFAQKQEEKAKPKPMPTVKSTAIEEQQDLERQAISVREEIESDPNFADKLGRWSQLGATLDRALGGLFPGDWSEEQKAAAKIESLTAQIRNMYFGASLTKGEQEAAKVFLPNADDTVPVLIQKLKQMEREAGEKWRERVKAAQAQGYDISGYDVDDWRKLEGFTPDAQQGPSGERNAPKRNAQSVAPQDDFDANFSPEAQ